MSAFDPSAIRDNFGTLLARTPAAGLMSATSLTRPSSVSVSSDSREVVQLLTSQHFRRRVSEQSAHHGVSPQDGWIEVAGYLREMSAWHHPTVTERWQQLSAWLVRGYDVLVDDDALGRLRKLDGQHPLIFLISHRSYLDEFVLPPALISGGLCAGYGLAGANLDFFPLGTLARRAGIVHVRRATADIPLYRLALRAFIGQLVANQSNLIWSIEGGRSRTGKLRPPRYGLLRYVADALDTPDTEDTPDIVSGVGGVEPLLIPTSIMYDQLPVHEVERMTSEAKGAGKKPEDLPWLLHYAAGLRNRLGRVYLDFGEPVPLRQRLAELRGDNVAPEQLVERVAIELCHRINEATPVTPTAAVCVALLGADRALTLDQVLDTVRPLAAYLTRRGVPVAGGANLTDRSTLRWALRALVRSGVLTSYSGGTQTVGGIRATQHLIAAVYRNSAIHAFVVRAIAELALLAVAENTGEDAPGPVECPGRLVEEALRLRELLKFDFFFAQRDEFIAQIGLEVAILADRETSALSVVTPEQARHWLYRAEPLLAPLMLRPFLQAYQLVGQQLAELDEGEAFDQDRLLERCLRIGHQWVLQRTLASEESVSTEMFGTALKLAAHRDLLTSERPEIGARRREFAYELRTITGNITRLATHNQPANV